MQRFYFKLTLLMAVLLIAVTFTVHFAQADQPAKVTPVIVISLDGFRHDYIAKFNPPRVSQLAERGTVSRLEPVYPAKTFPNHISLATGLYPSKHGIVDNYFYDIERNDFYGMGKGYDDSTWLDGIPIWNLAEQQGLRAATYFWPESDARVNGMSPSYFYRYSHYASPKKRIEQIIRWLQQPDETRPALIMSYFHQIDSAGHRYGPNGAGTGAAVHYIDGLIGQLIDELARLELEANLILVADHGMLETLSDDAIHVDRLPLPDGFERVHNSTRVMYYAKNDAAQAQLSELQQQLESLDLTVDINTIDSMKRAGYQESSRSGDLIIDARPPVTFSGREIKPGRVSGTHGYTGITEMDAVFIAVGPAFSPDRKVERLRVIDVYPLIAKLLELRIEEPIDGNENAILPLLETTE
ncbi:alkaline phosphatase family protein [Pseudidiomarina aestuarii]|uniref:Alkaline phosphatase family protein n=1 Tax=Pseudidiomarina aestuarii TaxID=624146 RepID=A0A7Z6ZTQ0_9GAMM|nr:ectonucleotide pyrophosphatase/phosphodiesterase [Pseudidiomarina aestuarii]RUO41086.1 alkaline phosphatase family protein [Pseudidiomarina aestuarii]